MSPSASIGMSLRTSLEAVIALILLQPVFNSQLLPGCLVLGLSLIEAVQELPELLYRPCFATS